MNAAQLVKPINGARVVPSTTTLMSLRENETLKTPSASLSTPLAPASSSILAVSRLKSLAKDELDNASSAATEIGCPFGIFSWAVSIAYNKSTFALFNWNQFECMLSDAAVSIRAGFYHKHVSLADRRFGAFMGMTRENDIQFRNFTRQVPRERQLQSSTEQSRPCGQSLAAVPEDTPNAFQAERACRSDAKE